MDSDGFGRQWLTMVFKISFRFLVTWMQLIGY